MNIRAAIESIGFYYAGVVLVTAAVLGGGTEQSLWSDHVLQVLLIPSVIWGLGCMFRSRLSVPALFLVCAVLLVALVQFVPLHRSQAIAESAAAGWGFWSPAPGKSLESGLFIITAIGFFVFVARLSDQTQIRLHRFLVIGLMVNLVAIAVQLSFDSQATIVGLLPFEIKAGMFANENHLSALFYLMIPFFAYRYLVRDHKPLLFVAATLGLTGILFAIGSRAGMALAPTLAVLSLLWFVARDVKPVVKLALLTGTIAVVSYSVWALGLYVSIDETVRATFLRNTAAAISDNWLSGTGMGTFTLIYPSYEKTNELMEFFANHAHNDYLEIVLELGIAGAVLIISFLCLLLTSFGRSKYAQAALIAILGILLQSLVDYPLRTEAIAIIFAYCCAVILSVRGTNAAVAETTVELVALHSNRRRRESRA